MISFFKKNINYFIILIAVLLSYHTLWYHAFTFKWDMAEQYLPWRYFIGTSLQNNHIPWWNPYQLGGYPFYADPQSGFWYYPTWIIGYLFGYNMQIIQYEFILTIMIGTIGFYKLLLLFKNSSTASLLSALAFSCSGFYIGNAQHLTWIVAASWIPWVLYFYYQLKISFSWKDAILFSICTYLLLSGGYPAFSIVLAYFIFIDWLLYFIQSNEKKRLMLSFGFSAIILLFLSAGLLWGISDAQAYFSRGSGLSVAKINSNPFTPNSLVSLLFPFASFKANEWFKTDISMSNAYMGLLTMIFLFTSFFRKWTKFDFQIIALSFFILLISFGDFTPLRSWLYYSLPGFNLFRFPSLFRYFFILLILIFNARNIDAFLSNILSVKKIGYSITILFTVCLIAVYISLKHQVKATDSIFDLPSLSKYMETSTVYDHIFSQAILHLMLMSILLLFLVLIPSKKKLILISFVFIELNFSNQLQFPATVVYPIPTKNVDQLIANAPKDFPIPNFLELNSVHDEMYEYRWPLNWNMNCYFKQVAIDGYNPFVLSTYSSFLDSSLSKEILKNTWLHSTDTLRKIETVLFEPNSIQIWTTSPNNSELILYQNYFQGRNVSIDNQTSKLNVYQYTLQKVDINKGKHLVIFSFKNIKLEILLAISLITLSIGLLASTLISKKKVIS